MPNKDFEERMKKDIHGLTPKLSTYHNKAGIVNTALGKIEREKRPLVTRLTLIRAVSHTTDFDNSPEAEAYRKYLLEEAIKLYVEVKLLEQKEEAYKDLINLTNSKFVNDVKEDVEFKFMPIL